MFNTPQSSNRKGLDQIAIDEICIGKGRHLTVLLNLKSGAVIFVGDGKGSEVLEPFWEKIKGKRSVKIKAVAVDIVGRIKKQHHGKRIWNFYAEQVY